jgi:hypothetical protein
MRRIIVLAALLTVLIAEAVISQGGQQVRVLRLGRRAAPTTTVFSLGTSAGVDTTVNFNPATFTSIILQAHSANDSVDITATAYAGVSDAQMQSDDTWEIESTGTHVQMIYLPVSLKASVVFTAGPNNGSDTTIDSVWVARQW